MATAESTERCVSPETVSEGLESTLTALFQVASLVSIMQRAAADDTQEGLDTQNICDAIRERLGPTYEAIQAAQQAIAHYQTAYQGGNHG